MRLLTWFHALWMAFKLSSEREEQEDGEYGVPPSSN